MLFVTARTTRRTEWKETTIKSPPPGANFSGCGSRFPGNPGIREIARRIHRELGCAPRKSPEQFPGCAAKIPWGPPRNSRETHSAGNPRGFPGTHPASLRGFLVRGSIFRIAGGFPRNAFTVPSPEQLDIGNRPGASCVPGARFR